MARKGDLYEDLVDRLMDSYESMDHPMRHVGHYELPSKAEVVWCLEEIRALLFPGFVGERLRSGTREETRAHVRVRVGEIHRRLRQQVFAGLHHRCRIHGRDSARSTRLAPPIEQSSMGPPGGCSDTPDCEKCAAQADGITQRFLQDLPRIREILSTDVDAHYEGDPAARGTDEVIFCYPGLMAISTYRIANCLLEEGAAIIPRMMTEYAHEKTGVDIHPGAHIGRWFFIDHGTGIVIGETTVIGERVRIYQGVTLGALSLPKGTARAYEKKKRHPTLEDDVIIYANATILGGETVIGKGAVIGGNCWVTSSVPPGARLTVDGRTIGPK